MTGFKTLMISAGCIGLLSLTGCMSMEKDKEGFPVDFTEKVTSGCMDECEKADFSLSECKRYCKCYQQDIRDTMTFDEYQQKTMFDTKAWNKDRKRLFEDCQDYLPDSVFCRSDDPGCRYYGKSSELDDE